MMRKRNLLKLPKLALTAMFALFIFANEARAEIAVEESGSGLAVIKGVVRDKAGNPISKATVAIFRVGTSKILKQVTATSKGRFFAKIMPGTYTILAVAQGFNPVTLEKVKVNRSAELVYGFKLERSGLGNTLPEKRADRNSPKWRIRAASRRSIYQNREGKDPVVLAENETSAELNENAEQRIGIAEEEEKAARKGQTVVETYFASNKENAYTAINFATLQPVGNNTEIVLAGQVGTGKSSPKRIETILNYRPNEDHAIRAKGSYASLGKIKLENDLKQLGQASFQLLDQWRVRDGVILVVGFDYSRFTGAGNDSSISPRFGFQYDLDSKTRIRTAYTNYTATPTWQSVIELEGTQVLFPEPVAIQDIAIKNEKPVMQKSRRLEFGVERVLDNRSSIEANLFLDTVSGRGVGIANLPFESLGGGQYAIEELNASQHGKTQGFRVVYTRRLNEIFSTALGYSIGTGQRLSGAEVNSPKDVFENALFQTLYGQVDADFRTGTNIRTIFRLSPKATVFAIDPFQGRLAIYDPGLSVIVTQNLPNWGLPIDAEAVLDTRNLFDFQDGVKTKEGLMKILSQRSMFRGGILVRF